VDNDLLLADRRARGDALDISRSFIIQAPAGSGKTELLIQRYLHLLAAVNEPEEIVAITFTRKAAEEMRRRIVVALENARRGKDAVEPHQQITLQAARRVVKRGEELAWDLEQSPQRMRIQTLDAFNAGIARSLPVSSGIGGISRTIADAEMQSLYEQAATGTLDWLGSGETMQSVVENVLSHLDNNTNIYISHLSRMLQKRDQWLALLGSGMQQQQDYDAARLRLEQGIADVIVMQLRRLTEILPVEFHSELASSIDYAAGNLVADNKPDHPLAALLGCTELPPAHADYLPEWQAIVQLLLIQSGALRKTVTKNNGFPASDSGQKEEFKLMLSALRQIEGMEEQLRRVQVLPPARYSDDQWNVLVALFRLLPQAVAELLQLFSEKSVCDHVEVALAAATALGSGDAPGEIALLLDNRIQHLLVDEMQDTSLRQYQMLQDLMQGWTPGDGRTLFCVGDPMQSIYRFRDAEVAQFVLARDSGIGPIETEFRILRRNFRSGEHLVHWFNTVFSQVMPVKDDLAAGAIAYAASVPVEARAASGVINLHPLIDCDAMAEARIGADLVRDCVAKHPDDSVVVLVRSRSQLTELLSRFRSNGTPFAAVEIDRLTDLPVILDLLALTRAICHEGDRIAWLGLLHGPWVGLEWREILALVVNDSHSTIAELMVDPQRLETLSDAARLQLKHFAQIMIPARRHAAIDSLRQRVERCWYELGGAGLLSDADDIANVYQYFDVLGKIETHGTLADVRELESLLDQERVSTVAAADCNLQVMTMHKSKGLQFDHVFLYGLGRATRASQKSVLSWLTIPQQGESDMIISPIGARADLQHDPLHQFIEETEKDKQRQELDRLLYVACTRAIQSLHLIGSVKTNAKGDKLLDPKGGSLLQRMWPAVESSYEAAFIDAGSQLQESPSVGTPESRETFTEPLCRRYTRPWQAEAIPDLPQRPKLPGRAPIDAEQRVQFHWVGANARHAGTIVHRWLHRLSRSESLEAAAKELSHEAQTTRWARQLGVRGTALDDLCERVTEALDGTLSDEKGRWLLQGDGYSEYPLTGIWNGNVVSIVIDRVRIDGQGLHWIVDYKTSTHEGGNLAAFLQTEETRYRPQLEKYAEIYAAITDAPIRTALYFPLLQEFREIGLARVSD